MTCERRSLGECPQGCEPRESLLHENRSSSHSGALRRSGFPRHKGRQRHHPRKGKPVARLGRKTKGRLFLAGSLVAERMLAIVLVRFLRDSSPRAVAREASGFVPCQREVECRSTPRNW